MSDLASICEYITTDKMCNAVAENVRAKENRQVKCKKEEKMSCCYLCTLRPRCTISCNYLGSPNVKHVPIRTEEAPTENMIGEAKEVQETQITNNQTKHCLSCNVEMSETKTELRVDRWKGLKPSMPSADMLPVVIYLCPRCGKIEFKAYRQQSKD
ncbi:MAG TPA: hypothetical protein VK209_12160 [Candidatus Sulfotelmatobacter sp.]|nr:hypothetical protein [Candidatus Sulfotelmatobacter sp.]